MAKNTSKKPRSAAQKANDRRLAAMGRARREQARQPEVIYLDTPPARSFRERATATGRRLSRKARSKVSISTAIPFAKMGYNVLYGREKVLQGAIPAYKAGAKSGDTLAGLKAAAREVANGVPMHLTGINPQLGSPKGPDLGGMKLATEFYGTLAGCKLAKHGLRAAGVERTVNAGLRAMHVPARV